MDVQREAVRGIANISAEYAYTAVIAGAGAIMPLVAMLSSPDFLCQRYEQNADGRDREGQMLGVR